jgi:hemin uptake protein HemP
MNAVASEEENSDESDRQRISGGIERQVTMIDNCLESRDLFVGARDIVIRHESQTYHLRLTAQNKLILTK